MCIGITSFFYGVNVGVVSYSMIIDVFKIKIGGVLWS